MKILTLTGIAMVGALAVSAAQTVTATDMPGQQILAQATCKKTFVRKGQYFTCEQQTLAQKATCKWPHDVTLYIAYLNGTASNQGVFC